MAQRLLVVGGNGFLGSSVCRIAVSRGWNVTSISSSGRPFQTPKRHSPAWVYKVDWHAASAFDPSTFSDLIKSSTAVVHTLGTLFENSEYKKAIRSGNPVQLLSSVLDAWTDKDSNPLATEAERKSVTSYQALNYDSALIVLEAFHNSVMASRSGWSKPDQPPRPFIYISAEDIFRPFVPRGYIDSKRAAERAIKEACASDAPAIIRSVFLRPGLMYHPHLRPLTTPLATVLSLMSNGQRHLISSNSPFPTPSAVLRSLAQSLRHDPPLNPSSYPQMEPETDLQSDSTLESMANAFEIPPLHVDHVAQAACNAIEYEEVNGVLDVKAMRDLIGWEWDAGRNASSAENVA